MRTLLAFLILATCGGDDSPQPTGWTIGTLGELQPIGDSFAIPACSQGLVGYVTRPAEGALSGSMTLTYEITGDAEFRAPDSGKTPMVTMYFQRRGDNWTGQGDMQFYRWWAGGARGALTPGVHTLEAPLVYDQWTSIFAKRDQEQFQAALNDPRRVGFTLGGWYFGHGVCAASGDARFRVHDFTVE